MVKGNWERRVERAAKQKAAKRDAAAAKAKGQLVDPLDILNAVFLKDPDASVWVSAGNAKLCAAYFRHGDCPNRRCKWSHAETIAPFGGSTSEATTEAPVEQVPTVAARLDGAVPKAEFNDGSVLAPVPEGVVARVLDWCSPYRAGAAAATCRALRRAAALSAGVRAHKDAARPRLLAARRRRVLRMARSVRFAGATVDGRRALAYDAERPDVFRAFSRPRRSVERPARKKAPARPFNKLLEEAAAPRAVATVLGALPDAGAAAVAATSKRLRALTKADDAYRRRRRRGLEARTAQRKTRKKGKRQGKDTRKKDEFARGQ